MAGKVLVFLVAVAIGAVLGGFYIQSRELETAKIAHITALSQIQGVTPTECSFSIGAYGSGSAGNMFIYNNKLSVNIPDLNISNFNGDMVAVLGIDGTRIIAPASVQAAGSVVNAAAVLNTVIMQAPWNCSPWWFPNGSLFQIPDGETF